MKKTILLLIILLHYSLSYSQVQVEQPIERYYAFKIPRDIDSLKVLVYDVEGKKLSKSLDGWDSVKNIKKRIFKRKDKLENWLLAVKYTTIDHDKQNPKDDTIIVSDLSIDFNNRVLAGSPTIRINYEILHRTYTSKGRNMTVALYVQNEESKKKKKRN